MTNYQESKYSMMIGTRDYLIKNSEIAKTLPAFGELFPGFNANINQIQVQRELQEIDKSGITDTKSMLRFDLTSQALDVSRKTEVYARMNNNAILAKEVHYSETDLNKSADSKLKDKALVIYDKANANVAALAVYGIRPEMLTALKNSIDLFNASIPTTRTGKTETKQVTNQLTKLLKANDELLTKFDLLVEVVRLTEPVFYSGYKDHRKIINTGTGSLAMIAKATDALTGEAVKGVKFTLIHQNGTGNKPETKTGEQLVKITAQKGILHIKNLTDGPYLTIVSKTGYKEKELIVNKATGDRINLNVQLERV